MGRLGAVLLSSRAIFLMFCAVAAGSASRVDPFAHPAQPMLVHPLPARLPHMPRHHLGGVRRLRALLAHRAVDTLLRVRVVLPVAFAVRGSIGQQLAVGADVDIKLFLVPVVALVEVAVAVRRRAIADHAIDVALFQPLRNRCRRLAGIHAHGPDVELEPFPLPVQAPQVRN